MAKLFGWEFRRSADEEETLPSFAPPATDDGAVVVAASGSYGTYVDLEGTVRTEAELVTKYREMAVHPEVDSAIDEIVNDAVTKDENTAVVKLFLDRVEVTDKIKKIIESEFTNVLKLMSFNSRYYDIFRRWYVDGRLYFHAIIDEKKPEEGLKELRYIDPRKIRKIREIAKKKSTDQQQELQQTRKEYYIYSDKGFNYGNKTVGPTQAGGMKIAKDAVVHVTSGLTDTQGTMVLSYLHKGIKPLNQLRVLEDATVIYRISRAPERRVWYIDIGGLPKMKAEQYVRDIMVKHKNRLIYDAASGEIRDDRKFMTMLEDYWLPRREGGRGTEVTTLPAGQNLGQMQDVEYFQKKLYGALNVPITRLDSQSVFGMGRPSEITREELKFAKFIERLRSRFNELFLKTLEKQLVLKNIMNLEEWNQIKDNIEFTYTKDNYFSELKDQEILMGRVNTLNALQPFIGTFYSNEWTKKNVLYMNDEEIEDMNEQIAEEQQIAAQQQAQAMQDQTAMQQGQIDQQQPQDQGGDAQPEDTSEQQRKILMAQKTVEELQGKKNRSLSDESRFRSAVAVLSKNQ